jgi:hypothetical protein
MSSSFIVFLIKFAATIVGFGATSGLKIAGF